MNAIHPAQPPVVLTIAGSDSSCGAGAQADIKSIAAMGGYGLNALTSVVSEAPGKMSLIRLLDPEIIEDQIRVLLQTFPVRAAKMGMIGGRAQAEAVAAAWKNHAPRDLPLVVDPVMVATGGGRLLEDEAVSAVVSTLLPLATLITPNMDEAGVLVDRPVRTREDMAEAALEMADRFQTAVLVKGGHLAGDDASDVLVEHDAAFWIEGRRTPGVHTHGTGCSLSAATATGLAKGLPLRDAVIEAKNFISRAIARHLSWGAVHALNHLPCPS
jgi:hydroxymethylpyrimidine/phosphomethylpyrimidine kinase